MRAMTPSPVPRVHVLTGGPRAYGCRTGWRPLSVTAACDCPAASASERPSRGHCCAGPGCSSWTRRRPSSTRSTRRTARGGIIQDSAYGAVWAEARKQALTEAQFQSPLGRRPYDLRH